MRLLITINVSPDPSNPDYNPDAVGSAAVVELERLGAVPQVGLGWLLDCIQGDEKYQAVYQLAGVQIGPVSAESSELKDASGWVVVPPAMPSAKVIFDSAPLPFLGGPSPAPAPIVSSGGASPSPVLLEQPPAGPDLELRSRGFAAIAAGTSTATPDFTEGKVWLGGGAGEGVRVPLAIAMKLHTTLSASLRRLLIPAEGYQWIDHTFDPLRSSILVCLDKTLAEGLPAAPGEAPPGAFLHGEVIQVGDTGRYRCKFYLRTGGVPEEFGNHEEMLDAKFALAERVRKQLPQS